MYACNQDVVSVGPPPIAAARQWLRPDLHGDERPLIDLSQAVPDYAPPDPVQEALRSASIDTQTTLYTDITGLPALRDAFAIHQSEFYRAPVNIDQVAITAGCNQAFCATMQTLAGAGDDIIMALPYYFNHQMWLDILGIRTQHVPFDATGGGVPDLAEFESRIGPRTRAIMIVTPNNPTGATWPADVLDSLLELALSRGIALVVDETYKDFHHDGGRAHHFFHHPDWSNAFIQLYSFSKAYSLTGHRVGAVTASPAFLTNLTKVLDCSQICAPHPGQLAALAGIQHCRDFVDSKKRLMAARAEALGRQMADKPGGFQLMTLGAYFAYVHHPYTKSDGEPLASAQIAQQLAKQQNVLTLPGSMFGPDQDAYLRVAFANVETDALDILRQRLTAFTPE